MSQHSDVFLNLIRSMQKPCINVIFHRILLLLVSLIVTSSRAQNDSLQGFNLVGALKHAKNAYDSQAQERILEASKRQFIKDRYFPVAKQELTETEGLSQRSAGNCDNMGFETGNTNGWNVKGDYAIVSSGTDPFGKFPKVNPGGRFSLQLNNNNITSKTNFDASATKLMNVTNGSSTFNLRFAFVILNYPHDSSSAARFKISLRDSTKHADICAGYNIYYEQSKGPIGTSNFSISAVNGVNAGKESHPVTYAPWQSISIDLSQYIGRAIAIKVSCDWCVYKVDWAYCYIDGDCNPPPSQAVPCAKIPGTLSGPPGLSYYKWLTPEGKTVVSSTRTLAMTSVGTYDLYCNQTSGCNEYPFFYKYQISEIKLPTVQTGTQACNLSVNYAVYEPIATSSYTWFWNDSVPTVGRYTTTHKYEYPGLCTATLQIKDADGCLTTMLFQHSLTAGVDISTISNDPPGKLFGPDDYKSYEAISKYDHGTLIYNWEGENYSVADKYAKINKNGVYIVKATDPKTGCKDTAMVNVELKGWIPNIFTPNNDGKNDLFRFRYMNDVVLRIINRWDQFIYEAKDEDSILSWDGTTNNKPSSDGVYFYTITPIDNTKKAISGTVTLLR